MGGCYHLHSSQTSMIPMQQTEYCMLKTHRYLIQVWLAHDSLKEDSCITDTSVLLEGS